MKLSGALWFTKGMVGQTGVITAGIGNTRYAETVQVDIYKSTSHGGYVLVDTGVQAVGVMKPRRPFSSRSTTHHDDLAVGKVSFKAAATILGACDAVNGDNEATSTPTLVTRYRATSPTLIFGAEIAGLVPGKLFALKAATS